MLSVGIVGLPNSGKSTLFNSLLKKQVAGVASYPFTTIEPNVGVVAVPDERLAKIGEMIKPEKLTPAAVKFIDIAGLIKDSHKGEGLGNKFLAKIREVDAIVQVVRVFENEAVSHFYGNIDPVRDKEIIDLELALGEIKKPTLYVLNVKEIGEKKWGVDYLQINAQTGEGIGELIKKTYALLGLITFYTVKGGKEVRAWALPQGETALSAAGKVHQDMARGFVKAEVVSFENLLTAGGWPAAKNQGKVRLEGRDYEVKDEDVMEFKFNV